MYALHIIVSIELCIHNANKYLELKKNGNTVYRPQFFHSSDICLYMYVYSFYCELWKIEQPQNIVFISPRSVKIRKKRKKHFLYFFYIFIHFVSSIFQFLNTQTHTQYEKIIGNSKHFFWQRRHKSFLRYLLKLAVCAHHCIF